jgi:hypothetical protein
MMKRDRKERNFNLNRLFHLAIEIEKADLVIPFPIRANSNSAPVPPIAHRLGARFGSDMSRGVSKKKNGMDPVLFIMKNKIMYQFILKLLTSASILFLYLLFIFFINYVCNGRTSPYFSKCLNDFLNTSNLRV